MRQIVLALILNLCLVIPCRAMELDIPDLPTPEKPPAEIIDLNLASSLECVPASILLKGKKSILLNEGKSQKVVTRRSMLTAAEYFSAKELIDGRAQTLTLCGGGTAIGGRFVLDDKLMSICRGLLVPSNVEVIQDISQLPKVDLEGELKINGRYVIVGAKPGDAYIKARWIKLQPGSYFGACLESAPLRIHVSADEELQISGQIESSSELDLRARRIARNLKPDKSANALRTATVEQSVTVDILSGDVAPVSDPSAYKIKDVIESFLPIGDQEAELIAPAGNEHPVDSEIEQKERKT
jgi:hypothetical protein